MKVSNENENGEDFTYGRHLDYWFCVTSQLVLPLDSKLTISPSICEHLEQYDNSPKRKTKVEICLKMQIDILLFTWQLKSDSSCDG
ncbi:CLUMA_CG005152, isoform A [Clunio marinus]|uniref:CLUMA_CG005152, isoform A n=1 Tax=Clunio marinus TaxID=568069 RepID=A0A1J1HU08_9DIPT|nr:CLUMA_CG005152, isoform A [Clunio marinus]